MRTAVVAVRPPTAHALPNSTANVIAFTCNSVTVSGFLQFFDAGSIFWVQGAGATHIGPTVTVSAAGSYTITLAYTANPGTNVEETNTAHAPNTFFTVPRCASGGFQGPTIPTGFALRIMTCDTPVFDTAGGTALSTGEHITAGQTWFVSPTPVTAPTHGPVVTNGLGQPINPTTSWTEIFNSSVLDGFIPTACVGGRPLGYGGA